MSRIETIVRRWSAISRFLPQVAPARARHSRRRLTLEHLEGRVVPSTILVTSLHDSGRGTLRAAIQKANHDPNHLGGQTHSDTIKFARSVRGTIHLKSALPVLLTQTVISGPGPSLLTVAGDPAAPTEFRIFTVGTGAKIAITGLTITAGAGPAGGGINNAGSLSLKKMWIIGNSTSGGLVITQGRTIGGGIDNTGTLSVTDSRFEDNSSAGNMALLVGYSAYGGGIANSGRLSVTGCAFVNNSATGGAGGTAAGSAGGGAIENIGPGRVFVTDSSFIGNSATGDSASGAAIDNPGGTLSVTSSTFSGNVAKSDFRSQSFGGGIHNSGTLSVTGSTFSGNSATSGSYSYGGGIQNSGTLSVTNSTLNGNSATGVKGSLGGGIANTGVMAISYVTADNNSAVTGGGVAIAAGGTSVGTSIDSIFQNSQGGNLSVVSASFTSLGHNLFSDVPGVSLTPTDQVNADPLLRPLASNGGPTQTQALFPGSPAIKAGIAVAGITTDQRGAPRPQSGTTDLGAFQVQPTLIVKSIRKFDFVNRPPVLVLAFNMPLNVSRAESLGNYSLVTEGGNAHRVGIRSARYHAFTRSVTLRPRVRQSSTQGWILTVTGTPPRGLTTTKGAYLDGAGDGEPGTNYVVGLV